MKRREFIAMLGSVAAAWPFAARSQQTTASRHVGVFMGLAETDPFTIKYVQALRGGLEKLGWTEDQNIQFIYRYAAGDPDLARTYAVDYLRSVETVALTHSVQATLAPGHNSDEIENAIAALGHERGGGLIVLPSAPITAQIEHVIAATARYRIPAVYPFGSHAKRGGLIAYGVELNDLFRQAASYAL